MTATLSDFIISQHHVDPKEHKKPKGKVQRVKLTHVIVIHPDGSHEIEKSTIRRTTKPRQKRVKPVLMMKEVKRYRPNGKLHYVDEVIDVNRSLAYYGYKDIQELMEKVCPAGSAEARIKHAFVLKKKMTPEAGDQVTISPYTPMVGTY